ncbi:ADP-ribosylglycohydrolase family protein [Thalassotalea sp. Y01]|uniref:ADP-ribosylglycohydrolase family protein n=1 Tax=Thalassotalea sp. Y01 TaxID=2729613 RepID=UPI002007117A|nr:ADP-ribosylglycohydrolase family protein [Thalassotalea sp. Y01]
MNKSTQGLNTMLMCFALLGCSEHAKEDKSLQGGTDDTQVVAAQTEDEQGSQPVAFVEIDKQAYQQRLQGFWLGQSIANWTGLITEMDKVGTPETMPFYTDQDWGSKDLPAMWGEGVPHSDVIDFYLEHEGVPWGADDDTDIEYIYLHLHHQLQTAKLTAEQIKQGWLKHTYSEDDAPLFKKFADSEPVKENFLWESNERARILMAQGMLPPETSEPKNNAKYMMIDAQLTTEFFGLLAPVNVAVAKDIAYLPIRVAANHESEQIANFYVVMHSLASSVDKGLPIAEQGIWLATQARKHLKDNDYPAKMFDFVLAHYRNNPDKQNWEATRDAVYQRYQIEQADGYQYKDPFEAGINYAASLVSWFYGQGEIKRTIQIGSLSGWDSDNPTATWGGLLGFLHGIDGVKSAFASDNISDTYWIHRTRRNFPDHTPTKDGEDSFALMAERMLSIIDLVVVEKMQGRSDANKWQIPVALNTK